jgi:predicted nucleotidyltransferase
VLDNLPIPVDMAKIAAFCRRHGVRELSLFGSVLRDDFGPDSDVDVLLDFHPGRGFTFENTPDIVDELEAIFGRQVDVVEKRRVGNPFRRASILSSSRVLYAA